MSMGEKKGVAETAEGDRRGLRNEAPRAAGPLVGEAQSVRRSGTASRRRSGNRQSPSWCDGGDALGLA